VGFEALDQRFQMELLGADALQRRECAAEHVIEAAVLARFFDRGDAIRFLDDADDFAVARGARAVKAGIGVGDVVAHGALMDVKLRVADRVGQREGLFGRDAQQVERQALRRLLADSGKALQLIDEF
jgi:hypothetical protein